MANAAITYCSRRLTSSTKRASMPSSNDWDRRSTPVWRRDARSMRCLHRAAHAHAGALAPFLNPPGGTMHKSFVRFALPFAAFVVAHASLAQELTGVLKRV